MPYPAKILIVGPLQSQPALAAFVEDCLRDGVELIAAVGPDASRIELEVDLLIVGDASDESRFICTTSHEDETFGEAYQFADMWVPEGTGENRVEVVRL
ncbi:hypothetical protein [Caulobacter sp. 17J80-11]|uniref:hypothetical protein n=1 Tax=Caulobacter sp. 17J80-11 TaxID=2763502 RepID=UPI001653621D|nr:hypothetical protein [Caulobacter sp. 17J80-11]MBC6981173.1 hypothetical protein [Caulobacter sp. 17J80-11]